jgi:hypothetical protein
MNFMMFSGDFLELRRSARERAIAEGGYGSLLAVIYLGCGSGKLNGEELELSGVVLGSTWGIGC